MSENSKAGLVLVDVCLKNIVLDQGAVTILRFTNGNRKNGGNGNWNGKMERLPSQLADIVRKCAVSNKSQFPATTFIRLYETQYICRTFLLEPDHRWFARPVVALCLERNWLVTEAGEGVSADYELTMREKEALKGLLVGLSSKDLAKQMRISPNTVKAFLRLIMTKVGVSSRAELFANILIRQAKPQGPASRTAV